MKPAKVLTLHPLGPILISADLHGHFNDFARLRERFLTLATAHERDQAAAVPLWISVGDWVHGPAGPDDARILDEEGQPLYAYVDRSAEVLRGLFALMDAYPGQVISLLGNHEYAHIGGPRTRKFHDDEAAHLEAGLSPAEVEELRRRFASWPLMVRLPSCGVVITHGAMSGPLRDVSDLEAIEYAHPYESPLLRSAMTHYGYTDGGDVALLDALRDPGGPAYELLIHGHDREETGHAQTGARSLLLCTSFGARRSRKSYLLLDPTRRYGGPEDLREGHEIRLLYS